MADARHPDHAATMAQIRLAAEEVGFLTVSDTPIGAERVREVLACYRAFFRLPETEKARIDMAATGSNRGWGAPRGERVDPTANPDYKEVFDSGLELSADDPVARLDLGYYAPNRWPVQPSGFRDTIAAYYRDACAFSLVMLRALARAIGAPEDYFDDKFTRPMALLRGNFYPARPAWAGARDFGIGAHTDYGCLTLLASDGSPGLEVRGKAGGEAEAEGGGDGRGDWLPLSAPPGEFIINFGEMLEMWTDGRVQATPHRVVGGAQERISVPLFFNPNHDTNVAPIGSGRRILAGDHLQRRFSETYLHLAQAPGRAP
ncbi:isopenicillin N synthase family dioxygenase [Brevirhabdus sp.]|uniref:isopenicillin N synthase family dioxygenase n=1 Tax=Brevirhabdus sp. TaxID=2004514 RepID=UPI004059F511